MTVHITSQKKDIFDHDTGTTASPFNGMMASLLFAIPFVVVMLITRLDFRFILDEGLFHSKVIDAFRDAWPVLPIGGYPSASTPLPYVLWTLYGKIVGFEIWKLRLLTVVITYLTVIMFYRLCRRHTMPYPLLSTAIFLFFPYFFFHGFTIYTVNFGLFFGTWALHYYLGDRACLSDVFKGTLLATLAIYCRQYFLVLPAGMLLYELGQIPLHDVIPAIRRTYLRWLILALPFVLLLPLFVLWGGLTTPLHQADHFVRPALQHLNFMLIFVGFYFLPMLFAPHTIDLLRIRKKAFMILVILLPLYFLFPLAYSEEHTVYGAAGIIVHGIDIVRRIAGHPAAMVLQFVLWVVGLSILLGEVTARPWNSFRSSIIALLATFVLLITLTPFIYERYYMLTVPLLILVLHRQFPYRSMLIFWLMGQMAVSIGFSYWQIVLK